MIELKEAAEIAKDFINEIDENFSDLHLESILLSTDKQSWEVTYSYWKKLEEPNDLQKLMGLYKRKFYKRVIIDNTNKQIIGFDNSYDMREAA